MNTPNPALRAMPFIFTNDDPGSGDVRLFHELLDFLRDEGVPGTFFTVPCAGGTPLAERPEWVEALYRAKAEGHDLQLHAYAHTGFEFGQPPDFMLDLMTYDSKGKGGWAELRRNRAQLERDWSREHLRDLLRKGQQTFRDVLGVEPVAFRAPCCSTCDALYEALSDVGIPCDSSQIIDPVGWDYCRKEFARFLVQLLAPARGATRATSISATDREAHSPSVGLLENDGNPHLAAAGMFADDTFTAEVAASITAQREREREEAAGRAEA